MESRPPQEPPRRPSSGRKPNSPNAAPTPPWVWLFLIAVVGVILWAWSPSKHIPVTYSWFLEQVDADNVKSLNITGLEATGQLRAKIGFTATQGAPERQIEF